MKIRDFPGLFGDIEIRLLNPSANDYLNCSNITFSVQINMVDSNPKIINVPFNTDNYGCNLKLRDIPILDNLTSDEKD